LIIAYPIKKSNGDASLDNAINSTPAKSENVSLHTSTTPSDETDIMEHSENNIEVEVEVVSTENVVLANSKDDRRRISMAFREGNPFYNNDSIFQNDPADTGKTVRNILHGFRSSQVV
jgi:hypothetical protein